MFAARHGTAYMVMETIDSIPFSPDPAAVAARNH